MLRRSGDQDIANDTLLLGVERGGKWEVTRRGSLDGVGGNFVRDQDGERSIGVGGGVEEVDADAGVGDRIEICVNHNSAEQNSQIGRDVDLGRGIPARVVAHHDIHRLDSLGFGQGPVDRRRVGADKIGGGAGGNPIVVERRAGRAGGDDRNRRVGRQPERR